MRNFLIYRYVFRLDKKNYLLKIFIFVQNYDLYGF